MKALVAAALDAAEELEGMATVVIPRDTDGMLRRILLDEGAIPAESLTDRHVPVDHALFEGVILDGERGEVGLRYGPFDLDRLQPREECGTKYRLTLETYGGRWMLRQFIVGGC